MDTPGYATFHCSMDAERAVAAKEVSAKTPLEAASAYKAALPKEIKPSIIFVDDRQGNVTLFSWDLAELDLVEWLEQNPPPPESPPPPRPPPTKEELEAIEWLEQNPPPPEPPPPPRPPPTKEELEAIEWLEQETLKKVK